MQWEFATYPEFIEEYRTYHYDECSSCGANCELGESDVECVIEDKKMYFQQLLVLKCSGCGKTYLPEHSKSMIDGAYRMLRSNHQNIGKFSRKPGYQEKFDYCKSLGFIYDYRDYYNIPGLCYDEEHSRKGFLTPVYFKKEALAYFLAIPTYVVDIFSESYGYLEKVNSQGEAEWQVPFGFNSNGKWVMWLGDIDTIDEQTQAIIRAFNVESDHLLVDSEFYQAQMKCIFSNPIIERRILNNKKAFIANIEKKYGLDISHLTEECRIHEQHIGRPVVFTEQTVSEVINAYDKILIEGFSIDKMRDLYEILYSEPERDRQYRNWKSIKMIQAILVKLSQNISNIDVALTMSPLYILHDYRIYFDHLLAESDREDTKQHILNTLGVQSFNDQETIYYEEFRRLDKLFDYLVVLSK